VFAEKLEICSLIGLVEGGRGEDTDNGRGRINHGLLDPTFSPQNLEPV